MVARGEEKGEALDHQARLNVTSICQSKVHLRKTGELVLLGSCWSSSTCPPAYACLVVQAYLSACQYNEVYISVHIVIYVHVCMCERGKGMISDVGM